MGRRPNYSHEKRQRELRKQKKKEEKLAKKARGDEVVRRPPEPTVTIVPSDGED